MSQEELYNSADDRALKQAVRAAWGGEKAPADLRRRVQMALTRAALEEPEEAEEAQPRPWWERNPVTFRWLSAAAILLLAIGLTWVTFDLVEGPQTPEPEFTVNTSLPRLQKGLLSVLAARHDDFAGDVDAAVDSRSPEKLQADRAALAHALRQPVWAPDLRRAGWTFNGTRIYAVNGVSAVTLLFTRGNQAVMAFSLPVECDHCAVPVPSDLEEVVDNRAIAGVTLDGNLFGLVGSAGRGPMPAGQLHALLSQFRSDPSTGLGNCLQH